MPDPLGELEDALAYMFELQKLSNSYINPLVHNLKHAIEQYKHGSTKEIKPLILAFEEALPVIEKYVDSYMVKQKMEALTKTKGEALKAYTTSRPENKTMRFTFFHVSHEKASSQHDLINWLSLLSGKDFNKLNPSEQAELLFAARVKSEFMTKLGEYLCSNPDFLVGLIMSSPESFFLLMNSRIGYQLEKQHIAKAICHHTEAMIDLSLDPFEQVEDLVYQLDKALGTTGNSLEKLLADPLANEILSNSMLMQILESEEYQGFQLGVKQKNFPI